MQMSSHPPDQTKIFICHAEHEHDRTYTENLVEYLTSRDVLSQTIALNPTRSRPELQACLDGGATAVLGFNAQLDHSWLGPRNFLDAARQQGIPVLQWILDHPSSRWPEFTRSTPANSRFLLNSEHERQFFNTYCLSGALTATAGGVGANRRSRVEMLMRDDFLRRPIACLIPLSLRRVRGIDENTDGINALQAPLANVVHDAVARARYNLADSLQSHVSAAVSAGGIEVSTKEFVVLCQMVEQSVQTFRRLKIFEVAQRYPALIQSDDSAVPFVGGGAASLKTNVGMQCTLARMPRCRAVLSVSPACDLIHDRTMNALNAGCVAIAENSPVARSLFRHGEDALLFQYGDDSLDECLDIVCNKPQLACEIAQNGMRLRDHRRVRFGQFHNIIDLAARPVG